MVEYVPQIEAVLAGLRIVGRMPRSDKRQEEVGMSRVVSFRRWLIALCAAGGIAGTLLGLTQSSAQATPTACVCYITGTGHYTCASPSSCTDGAYRCYAICPD